MAMDIFAIPPAGEIAAHIAGALRRAERLDLPYRRWLLHEVFPPSVCANILMLPIAPPPPENCGGVRDKRNELRTFFTPQLRADFPVCAALAEAFQSREVAAAFAEVCAVDARGAHLRMEYIQDTDGAWLEPHRDIVEKLFSMVVYLCTGPEAKGWGTDIYDAERRWVGRSSATFNSAVIFIAGPNTWHGFDKRPIRGVRRLMEINYVSPAWRAREQLSFPDRQLG